MRSKSSPFILASLLAAAIFTAPPQQQQANAQQTNTSSSLNNVKPKCGLTISGPKWIRVNDNDHNFNEIWDWDEEPVLGETDTDKIVVTCTMPASCTGSHLIKVSVKDDGLDRIDGFWPGEKTVTLTGRAPPEITGDDASAKQKIPVKQHPYFFAVQPGQSVKVHLWIEGWKHSASGPLPDVTIIAESFSTQYQCGLHGTLGPETHDLAVFQVDLDVDSDNNGELALPSESPEEDQIEASEKIDSTGNKKPGKYLFVNAGFNAANNDACPGWADGFDINPGSLCDNEAAVFEFTPVLIKLPEPFDPAKAEIEFTYEANDPTTVTFAPGGGTPSDPFAYTLGPVGKLRIWKEDGPGFRKKDSVVNEGDFVPNNVKFKWSKLTDERTAKLFLEAVRPSESLGDLNIRITVTEGGVKCEDAVNVTGVWLNNEEIEIVSPCTGYGFANSKYTAIGGVAAKFTVKADFLPASVDPSAFPMSDIKIGIMQNMKPWTDTTVLGDPEVSPWFPGVSSGTTITCPSQYERVKKYHTRVIDTTGTAIPLYADGPGSKVAPGGGVAISEDTPSIPDFPLAVGFPADGGDSEIKVASVVYTRQKIIMMDEFVVWVSGYDEVTKQVYPLAECEWHLKVDSTGPPPQKPQCFTQRPCTMVPVRLRPTANEIANDDAFETELPVSGSSPIEFEK